MTVSKRMRYEILRRDNHACRYCGESAPGAKLTVDHVLPVSLGGTDDPENLVAACAECNAGKASSSPDAETVAQVSEDAIRWARAVKAAGMVLVKETGPRDRYVKAIDKLWSSWHYGYDDRPIPRPSDWRDSLIMFYDRGLPVELLKDAAEIALGKRGVKINDTWRYFMGIAWRKLAEVTDLAKAVYDKQGAANGA